MTSTPIRAAALLAAAGVLAACAASTTSGTGRAGSPAGSTSASSSGPSAAGTTPATSGAPTPTSTVRVIPAPATPIETHTVHAAGGRTYLVKVWARTHVADCIGHAYGAPMIAFLRAHRCAGLDRVLATTTVHGRPVGYAESSTGFTGTPNSPYSGAAAFKRLVLADNTGSLNDLLREGHRLPAGPGAIPPTEAFGVIGQDSGVAVWDLWYLDRPTQDQDKALLAVIEDLYLQF